MRVLTFAASVVKMKIPGAKTKASVRPEATALPSK